MWNCVLLNLAGRKNICETRVYDFGTFYYPVYHIVNCVYHCYSIHISIDNFNSFQYLLKSLGCYRKAVTFGVCCALISTSCSHTVVLMCAFLRLMHFPSLILVLSITLRRQRKLFNDVIAWNQGFMRFFGQVHKNIQISSTNYCHFALRNVIVF